VLAEELLEDALRVRYSRLGTVVAVVGRFLLENWRQNRRHSCWRRRQQRQLQDSDSSSQVQDLIKLMLKRNRSNALMLQTAALLLLLTAEKIDHAYAYARKITKP